MTTRMGDSDALKGVFGLIAFESIHEESLLIDELYINKKLTWVLNCIVNLTLGSQGLNYKVQSISNGLQGVVSAHPLATKAGIDCLRKGGNAYDAIVTSAITLTVVEPMMSGALGCGVAMLHSSNNENYVCNFSGLIPNKFNLDDWREKRHDSLSILSPSAINAWLQINKHFGNLSFDELFEPAINYAENGFRLTEANSFFIRVSKKDSTKKMFNDYYKNSLKAGDMLFQRKTAAALRLIALHEGEALVNSPLSKAISLALKRSGSSLSIEDMRKEQVSWQKPLSAEVFSHQVCVPPPNSNGFMVLQAASMIEEFGLQGMKQNSSIYIDMVIKIIKKVLTQSKNLKTDKPVGSGHTTTILSHDSFGNTAIMTQTLGGLYGSGIWVDDFGLPFNGLGSYCLDDLPEISREEKNVSPQRAPSPMSLVQVFQKNELKYVFGTPGGFTIFHTELQVLLNLLIFKMPLDEAINSPRFFIDMKGGISIEDRVSPKVINELIEIGYNIKALDSYSWMLGCMQGFENSEIPTFVGDSRRHALSIAIQKEHS